MWKDRIKYRLSSLFGEDARTIVPRLIKTDGRRHAPRYALAMGLMLITAACTAFSAYLMKDVVNRIFVEGNYQAVWILSGTLLGIFTTKGFATYGHTVILGRIGSRIVADYQKRLFDNLLSQGVPFFAEHHSTEFLQRMNAGAGSARAVLQLVATTLGRDIVTLVGLCIVMIVQDPIMTLAGVIIMPVAVYSVRSLVRRARKIVNRQFASGGRVLKTLQETLQGIRLVKSYNLEEQVRARMFKSIDAVEEASNKMTSISSRSGPLMESLGGFAIAGIIMYAGHGVLRGNQMPGEFFSVITAFLLAYEPAKRLARLNIDLASKLTLARYLFDLLDSLPSEREDEEKPKLDVSRGQIEFRDIAFGYRAGEPVLRGISFIAEPGQTTALVGASGSGKSTIMNLIERFWDPQAGAILIDGRNISQVSRRSLRDNIAYVSQDAFLFSGTIRENIALGHPGASEAEIEAAAKSAHAHDFIINFPQGYDTPVGEHGVRLSGGQRARITIARAFLKNAPILLLDEPTAALDSESEREVQRALDELQATRTTLVIAHRLQTVIGSDKICVIDNGRIVEMGRHDELIARRGRYHSLYQMQHDERQAATA